MTQRLNQLPPSNISFCNRVLAISIAVGMLAPIALAGEVDPAQSKWYETYKDQENVPDPGQMLLNTDPEPDLSEGFTPLFNGSDLEGWKPLGGTSHFEAKSEEIIGTCEPGSNSTYLCSEKSDYKNFIFTCDLKWLVDTNTGIQFRSQSKPNPKSKSQDDSKKIVFGPQFEMEGFARDRGWSGGVYGQSCGGYFYPLWLKAHADVRAATKKNEFNRVTILADGPVVKTWINGVPASHWVGDGTYQEGFFGLQIHKDKQGKVAFKNVRVKELP